MEKVENEDHEKTVVPSEKHYADFSPAAVPVAPDGGIAPGYGLEPPAPIPSMTPENSMCLKGPCRYYWHLVTPFDAENPESTWEELGLRAPRQHNHTCLLNPGMETDLTESIAFECSRWDPIPKHDLVQIEARRRAYYESVRMDEPQEEIPETLDEEGDDDGGTDDATQG